MGEARLASANGGPLPSRLLRRAGGPRAAGAHRRPRNDPPRAKRAPGREHVGRGAHGRPLRDAPARPKWDDRDRFILSKGHCCPGLYAVLARQRFFSVDEFKGLRRAGHLLQGHTDVKIPGVDMSAGSLGMGLSYGNGVALGARVQGKTLRAWVMLGDGECQEGNVWEAAMTTPHRRLDNVTVVVDY